MSSADPRRSQAGFTLIEVLVAVMLSVLVGGIVFQVVRSESRFATVESARQEVQDNARGAVEIISSELRSAHSAGLVSADTNSISFLLPRVWGISCGGGTGTTLPAIFPNAGGIAFAVTSTSGLLADTTGLPDWGPSPVTATRATVTSLPALNPALGAAGNACSSIRPTAADPTLVSAYTVTGSNLPKPAAGQTVYLYQVVSYDVGQDASSHEWWVRRAQGGSPQPLAGPVVSQYGLAFSYYDANDNRIAPPITTLATLKTVRRIRVTAMTASRSSGRANLADTVSTSITLRNQ